MHERPGHGELAGRLALVTGGGQRVGAAIVRRLAAAGAAVAVHVHRSRAAGERLVAELQGQGADATLWLADLRHPEEITRLFAAVTARLGPLDLLVNNAACHEPAPLHRHTLESWERTQALNLRAPFLCSAAVVPRLRAGRGAIVNIADLAGLLASPGQAAHVAAKAGLVALTRALDRELGPQVRVNAIAPGLVLPDAGMDLATQHRLGLRIPRGPTGGVAAVAAAVVFLAVARHVHGICLPVDGGRRAGGAVPGPPR